MAQISEFLLPDVGEGLTEAEVLTWHVAVGDHVTVNQPLVEIETAKAAVELPSPYAGVVTALHVEVGTTVPVGTPIIAIATGAASEAEQSPPPVAGAPPQVTPPGDWGAAVAPNATEAKREAVLVGYGVAPSSATRRPRRKRAPEDVDASSAPPDLTDDLVPAPPPEDATGALRRGGFEVGAAVHARAHGGQAAKVRAKPPVRKRAKELGVDLSEVTPTGADGVITRADVEGASALGSTRSTRSDRSLGEAREERIPVRGVLKSMADAMVRSVQSAPHVTEWVAVDVTESVRLVERLRAMPELEGASVGPTLLAAWALCRAVGRHPRVNASWDDAAGELVVKHYVNLGVAAATPRGLVVPSIKDADRMDLATLGRALKDLTATARSGRSTPADLAGGTISLTNVGVFGVDGGTPILPPGQGAILALGQVAERPWVVDGVVVPRSVCQLTLSFDHRFVDGELGSSVLADVARTMTDPAAELVRASIA